MARDSQSSYTLFTPSTRRRRIVGCCSSDLGALFKMSENVLLLFSNLHLIARSKLSELVQFGLRIHPAGRSYPFTSTSSLVPLVFMMSEHRGTLTLPRRHDASLGG